MFSGEKPRLRRGFSVWWCLGAMRYTLCDTRLVWSTVPNSALCPVLKINQILNLHLQQFQYQLIRDLSVRNDLFNDWHSHF